MQGAICRPRKSALSINFKESRTSLEHQDQYVSIYGSVIVCCVLLELGVIECVR
jgi:hypothetical protein